MAHFNTPTISHQEGQQPDIRRPGPDEQRAALAVLLTGKANPKDPAVDHFIAFSRQHGMSLDGLWAAYNKQIPVTSSLTIPGRGRTAVLFISPIARARLIAQAARMIRTVVNALDSTETCLIQALLEPTQRLEQQMLKEAGFTDLARLVYMRHPLGVLKSPRDPDSPPNWAGEPLTVYHWSEEHRERFQRAILASYEDTLDCPGLVGVRQIQDIVEGHMAVGKFEPSWWTAYYHQDKPVGVLLLNPLIDRPDLELVYLGLSPAYRGHGLASALMNAALTRARAERFAGMLLALDESNAPAEKLYKSLGFRATGRKTAMIDTLK